MSKPFVFAGTPGPWRVRLQERSSRFSRDVKQRAVYVDDPMSPSGYRCLAWVGSPTRIVNKEINERHDANACLMAAAPHLLEFALAVPEHYLSPRLKAMREAALQKVQGGTHEPV